MTYSVKVFMCHLQLTIFQFLQANICFLCGQKEVVYRSMHV